MSVDIDDEQIYRLRDHARSECARIPAIDAEEDHTPRGGGAVALHRARAVVRAVAG